MQDHRIGSRTHLAIAALAAASAILMPLAAGGCSAGGGGGPQTGPLANVNGSGPVGNANTASMTDGNSAGDGGANSNADGGAAGPLPQMNSNSAPVDAHGLARGVVLDRTEAVNGRRYALYLPRGGVPTPELPVVVSLHGTGGNGIIQMGPDNESLTFGGHDFGGPT